MRTVLINILLIACLTGAANASNQPSEHGWNEVGVRLGIPATHKHEYLRQYEAFGVYGLPWDWRASSGWGLSTQASVTLGVLESGRNTDFIGGVGTALILNKTGSGFTTDLGINANFLGRRQIKSMDFGSILQFGAYIGFNYCFDNTLKIGYRLQHISNGHIVYAEDTPNPGLDMHLFGISYVY